MNNTTCAYSVHENFAKNLAYKDNILWDAYAEDQLELFKKKLNELFRDPEPLASNAVALVSSNAVASAPSNTEASAPSNSQASEPSNTEASAASNTEGSAHSNSETSAPSNAEASAPSNAEASAPSNAEASASSKAKASKSSAMEKIREAIYKSTIAQRKYTNRNLLATFILVTVSEGKSFAEAENATKFSIHLLVRTRKCMNDDDSSNCCMVFIDEQGNVYRNWTHFQETNVLPEGIALAPFKGVYSFKNDRLFIDAWMTPASSDVAKIAKTTDVVAGVGGFGAAGASVAAVMAPFMAPALPFLGAVCLATGAYSAVRSACNLYSRKDHEQSIALTDSSARGSWLGVASGALSVSSSVANNALAKLAMAGKEVSLAREVFVNGMNISTMLLSATGVGHGILDLILKHQNDEEISTIDVLQVAASLAIFTHSAYNFRLAKTIIAQAQNSKMSSYRSELSNRQRKIFDKMAKETIRTSGASKGRTDLIRLINEVPDNQYLNDLNKINKNLNKNGIRFSAGENGKIALNDEIHVYSGDLRNNVQHGDGDILRKVTQPIPNSYEGIPNEQTGTGSALLNAALSKNSNQLSEYVRIALHIQSRYISDAETFQDCVRNIIGAVGEKVAKLLVTKAQEFLQCYGQAIESFIKTSLFIDKVLWDLYKIFERKLTTLTVETIESEIRLIFEELYSYYERLSLRNPNIERRQCEVCKGFYQICPL